MKGLILTCKHHDGFCLWPSKYTEHSVKNSPWKGGKGDVVSEISDACRRHGLKFGVYLSPWDRNHKDYAAPEYITYYRNQLRELLTNYGPIFEVWFDGANGGDGYYGGARETRQIDNRTYYDWDNTWSIVRELQPESCMFSDAGPDIRWVGNEIGLRGRPCWSTINAEGFMPGHADPDSSIAATALARLAARGGGRVDPPRLVLPRLRGRPGEDAGKPAEDLLRVRRSWREPDPQPPARPSRPHPRDQRAVLAPMAGVSSTPPLRRISPATRSRPPAIPEAAIRPFGPEKAIDGNPATCWATDDAVTTPELVLDLGKPTTFNVVRIREYIALGQRINSFALDQWQGGKWEQFATGTSIGNQRLVRTQAITTDRVRLRITSAPVCPTISEVALFAEPG